MLLCGCGCDVVCVCDAGCAASGASLRLRLVGARLCPFVLGCGFVWWSLLLCVEWLITFYTNVSVFICICED